MSAFEQEPPGLFARVAEQMVEDLSAFGDTVWRPYPIASERGATARGFVRWCVEGCRVAVRAS